MRTKKGSKWNECQRESETFRKDTTSLISKNVALM